MISWFGTHSVPPMFAAIDAFTTSDFRHNKVHFRLGPSLLASIRTPLVLGALAGRRTQIHKWLIEYPPHLSQSFGEGNLAARVLMPKFTGTPTRVIG